MAIEGKYQMENSEHFEEFIKELGLTIDASKIDMSKPSVMEITINGDEYHIKSETAGITRDIKFKLGEEFEDEMNGRKFKNVITKDGDNKLIHVQKSDDGKTINVVREFTDDGATIKSTYNNITWCRKYKRV